MKSTLWQNRTHYHDFLFCSIYTTAKMNSEQLHFKVQFLLFHPNCCQLFLYTAETTVFKSTLWQNHTHYNYFLFCNLLRYLSKNAFRTASFQSSVFIASKLLSCFLLLCHHKQRTAPLQSNFRLVIVPSSHP